MAESTIDTSGPDSLIKKLKQALSTNVHGAKAGYLANDKGEEPYEGDNPPTLEEVALWNEFGGIAHIPARTVDITTYKKIDKYGNYTRNGRFVKKRESNFAQTHKNVTIPAHTVVIPARPFLARAQKSANARCAKLVKARMDENADIEQIAKEIGIVLQDEIQQQITKGNFVPNAPSTIKRKGSSRPLIDTGNLRQSVHWGITTNDGDKIME